MIKAGIIGATGYAGQEVARLLYSHPEVRVIRYGSHSYAGQPFSGIYPNFHELADDLCGEEELEELSKEADVIFTATPQGFCSRNVTREILSACKVIDLSADFRFSDASVYEKWYQLPAADPEILEEAVYGLCELYRDKVRGARLVANPGCYTTCSILTAYPLVKEGIIDPDTLIIDAKSGTSGAGRSAKTANLYCEVNENIKPYGVTSHRHTPEIEAHLSAAAGRKVTVSFTPHLVPMNRGILSCEYASLTDPSVTWEQVAEIYQAYYGKEHFIRLLPKGQFPETRFVEGSNFLDIGFALDDRTGRALLFGALDNLGKGAAGQAVQNMNLLFGLPEEMGLDFAPLVP